MKPLSDLAQRWPDIDALLDEALDLPADERDAWLASLVGERAALRDTLARLLAAADPGRATGDLLGTLPRLPLHAPEDEPAAGELVGPYRLLEPLGRGGMGLVWRAERADGQLKREVALKLPRLAWGSAMAERLGRERDILATLDHPHIARLLDAGVDECGRPYLALELVQGQPIDAYCAERALGVRERLALLLQVAAAVSHAHAHLVVHRDLKPGNVLVTGDGQVRLLDFGIAKLLEGKHTQETALTRVAGAALTLDYASPEQIRGEPLSTASDVYSLAVVAYELLSGTRPYRLRRGSAAELEEAIAGADVPLASSVALDPARRRALRGDLDAILNRALTKHVADRTGSVDAFAQDIERHLRGEPVLARPDSRRYRLAKFVRRHRVGVAAGGAVALAVLAGSSVALWQALVAREETRRANAEVTRQEAVRNLYMDVMTRLSVLAKDEPAAFTRPGAVNRVLREELDAYVERYKALPGAVQAQLESVAVQLNYANDFEGSLAVGERYLAHLTQHGAEPAMVINAHNLLGRTLFQLRRLDESLAMRRAGVAWAPQADDDRTARLRLRLSLDLGNMLSSRGQRAEAAAVLQRAEAVSARRFSDSLVRSEALRALANFHNGFDDQRALELAREAYVSLKAVGLGGDDDIETGAYTLGGALAAAGRPEEALPLLRESVALSAKINGQADANTVRASGRLAAALARVGQADAARAMLEQALAQQTLGATANRLTLRARLVEEAWLRGDVAVAQGHLAAEPEALLRLLGSRGADLFLATEARLLVLAGRPQEALARAELLHRGWRDRGLPSAAWLRILEALALAQLASGDTMGARATAESLVGLLDAEQARQGWAWRSANEWAALAAVRGGDVGLAAQRLARAEVVTALAPSAVERAESALRRAEVLALLGRAPQARAAAQAALADLGNQHADSPRLAQAMRLAGG
jgi:serine/threonine-protein kinase